MIQRRRVDFVYFATVDEALEHCENALLELRLEKSQHVSTDALRAVDVDDANLPPPPFLGRQQSLDFRAPDESGGNPKSEVVPSVVHSNPEVSLCILAEEHSLALPPLSDDSRAVLSAVIMSDAVAGMAVYPPEEVQRRAARNPDGHIRLRQRFTRHVESAYGIADLWPIVRYCDVVVCVPGSVIYDESDNEADGSLQVARGDKSLFILDKGQVTISLMIEPDRAGEGPTKHRVGKFGPGAILSVGSFLASAGSVTLGSTSRTVAVADSVCQLLRLPAARYIALEKSDPGLACRLCRMLVQVTNARSEADMAAYIRSKRKRTSSMGTLSKRSSCSAGSMTTTTSTTLLASAAAPPGPKPKIMAAISADSLLMYQLPPLPTSDK
jgi:hypothetical protein